MFQTDQLSLSWANPLTRSVLVVGVSDVGVLMRHRGTIIIIKLPRGDDRFRIRNITTREPEDRALTGQFIFSLYTYVYEKPIIILVRALVQLESEGKE